MAVRSSLIHDVIMKLLHDAHECRCVTVEPLLRAAYFATARPEGSSDAGEKAARCIIDLD